jgi:hypothetical protein
MVWLCKAICILGTIKLCTLDGFRQNVKKIFIWLIIVLVIIIIIIIIVQLLNG